MACTYTHTHMQVAETNMMNLVTYHQKGHLHLLGLWPTRNDLITVSWWAVMIQLLGMLVRTSLSPWYQHGSGGILCEHVLRAHLLACQCVS